MCLRFVKSGSISMFPPISVSSLRRRFRRLSWRSSGRKSSTRCARKRSVPNCGGSASSRCTARANSSPRESVTSSRCGSRRFLTLAPATSDTMTQRLRLIFGDIHNHNAHGYGRGSIERSVDIARRHLDFFAFTGHSSWHDLGDYGGRARHFIEGFRRLKETWTHIQKVIADANNDGRFCSFLGFEWHSNRYGDQCVVFPNDHQPLFYTSELKELRRFCLERSALMIPHHLAYQQGRRGVDWESFAPDCTPVVEVFSWHGNGEEDRGLYPFVGGSPGGRQTAGTARAGLARGLQFGFVASSDNHSGFPGAYGEGLMGAYVSELTRPAIIHTIQPPPTYS